MDFKIKLLTSYENIYKKIFSSCRFRVVFIITIITSFFLILNRNGEYNIIVAFLVIILNILELVKHRKNGFLLIVNIIILYCNYSITICNYFSTFDTIFTGFSNDYVSVLGINILCLFSLFLYLLSPSENIKDNECEKPITSSDRYNFLIEIALVVLLCLICYFGFTRPSQSGMRGTPSAIYEYSIILFIMGYYYSGDRLLWKIVFTLIALVYALQNFIFGGRITGIQVIMTCGISLFVDKINLKRFSILSLIGIPLLTLIGIQRGEISLSIESILEAFQAICKNKLALDTSYSAFYTSLTFLKAMEYTPLASRLFMFVCFFLSMIFGGRIPNSNLADYTREKFLHYWGGVAPFFGYFYFGLIGVFLLAWYISFLKKKIINSSENDFIKCLSVYVAVTAFRWYLYSPTQLFRGVMLLWIVYISMKYFDKIVVKARL